MFYLSHLWPSLTVGTGLPFLTSVQTAECHTLPHSISAQTGSCMCRYLITPHSRSLLVCTACAHEPPSDGTHTFSRSRDTTSAEDRYACLTRKQMGWDRSVHR
ncbi:hypothetical protein QBC35DRAFT_486522 [Podospora australis]|uniref:Uncharacterized protein n=1 Tax=Podospora australis TaxID=1536484 RepID=A0AAN7AMI4_9PEZI|nr:hypothetical protein QBC35DRAFT_486522 [Podospora australis]